MPIQRRLPKKGFTNIFRIEFRIINLDRLEGMKDVKEFTPEVYIKRRMARKKEKIKILGTGDIKRAITVSANKFSKSAKEKIEAAGGKALEI